METEVVAQPAGAAPEGLAAELAAFAKEQGIAQPEVKQEVVPEVPQPEAAPQPEAKAEAAIEVPEKFKAPDGTADVAKVEKSTVNAEAAIAKYREKERELRQLQNKVNVMQREVAPQTIPQAQVQQPAVSDLGQVTPQAIMEDLIQNGMAVDEAKKQAITMYKLAIIAKDTAYRQASQEFEQRVSGIQDRIEADSRGKELEAIGKNDPWVFSEEGLKTLFEIRQQNPYLNHSDRPWTAAYDKYLAEQAKKQRAGASVSMPTPKAPAALVTPVGAAPRPNVAPQIDYSNRRAVDSRLDKLPLDAQLNLLGNELSRRGLKIRK